MRQSDVQSYSIDADEQLSTRFTSLAKPPRRPAPRTRVHLSRVFRASVPRVVPAAPSLACSSPKLPPMKAPPGTTSLRRTIPISDLAMPAPAPAPAEACRRAASATAAPTGLASGGA